MIEGAALETLGLLQHPVDLLRLRPAVPLLLDDHHDLPAGRRALPAVERHQLSAVLDQQSDARAHQVSVRGDVVRPLDVQHHVHRSGVDPDLAVLRRAGGLCAGPAQLSLRRQPGNRDLRHLPGAADPAVHPAGADHPQFRAGRHAVVADPDLSDVPHPLLYVAHDGLLQGHTEGAGGVRPHRRRLALEGDDLHRHPDGGARHPVVRHHRLHAVVERIHLRPGLPVARPTRRPCRSASPRS